MLFQAFNYFAIWNADTEQKKPYVATVWLWRNSKDYVALVLQYLFVLLLLQMCL